MDTGLGAYEKYCGARCVADIADEQMNCVRVKVNKRGVQVGLRDYAGRVRSRTAGAVHCAGHARASTAKPDFSRGKQVHLPCLATMTHMSGDAFTAAQTLCKGLWPVRRSVAHAAG